MAGTPLQIASRKSTPMLVGPMGRIARMARQPYWAGRTEQVWATFGPSFTYTAANWGAVTFYLEAFFRATSAKALCRLYDMTAAAPVANSVITVDNNPVADAYRSAALTLVNGHEYQVQFGNQDQGAGAFLGARIIAI